MTYEYIIQTILIILFRLLKNLNQEYDRNLGRKSDFIKSILISIDWDIIISIMDGRIYMEES